MHASSPIRSVIPSLEGAVLAVLAGTTSPLSGRRVAALAGASHPAATAALSRLSAAGIVMTTQQPPSILYVANRDHLAWPAIEALAHLRPATFDLLRRTISEWAIAPRCALVFGSFARADGDEDSDIDLLLVRPDDLEPSDGERTEQWQQQLSRLGELVQRATGNTVQILDEDASKIRRRIEGDDPILEHWLRDGIDLDGAESLRVVLDDVADRRPA